MKQTAEERAEARYKFVDEATNKRHDDFNDRQVERRIVYATCIREEVEPLEARVERFRALVQRFVDHNAKWLGKGCLEADIQWDAIVGDCQELGFVPTNTEDNG